MVTTGNLTTGEKTEFEKHVFDRAALHDLLDGDESLCNELLNAFLQDMPVQFEKLKEALEGNDPRLVERQAHTIKGASANIGAHALSFAALEVETAGKDLDLNRARLCFSKLRIELERLRTALSSRESDSE